MLFEVIKGNEVFRAVIASSYQEAAENLILGSGYMIDDPLTPDNTEDVREFTLIEADGEVEFTVSAYSYETALMECLAHLGFVLFEATTA